MTRLTFDEAIPRADRSTLIGVALAVVAMAAFRSWASWIQGIAALYLETRIDTRAARAYLEHASRLPFSFLHGRPVGEIIQALRGLTTVREIVIERALPVAVHAVAAVAYLAVLAWTRLDVTVVLCVLGAALVGLGAGSAQRQLDAREGELHAQARQRGYLVERCRESTP